MLALLSRPFNLSAVGWLYNYNVRPDSFVWETSNGAWVARSNAASQIPNILNDYDIEYVPMITGRSFHPSAGLSDEQGICWLVTGTTSQPDAYSSRVACNATQMAETLIDVRRRLRTPVRWIMAQNEPWHPSSINYMSALEAADVWRIYVQPVAQLAGLQAIAPNVQIWNADWLADFVRACYDQRNAPRHPCDVESVAGIAVHEYNCKESFWNENYGTGSAFRIALNTALAGHGGYDWTTYVYAPTRKFWVTETNCNWEGGGVLDPMEACMRASGERPISHGQGSITTMNQLGDIAAWSWWTTAGNYVDDRRRNARMIDEDGCLLPPGRALVAINGQQQPSAIGSVCSAPTLPCHTSRTRLPPAIPPQPFMLDVESPRASTCVLPSSARADGLLCSCEYAWQDGDVGPSSVELYCE